MQLDAYEEAFECFKEAFDIERDPDIVLYLIEMGNIRLKKDMDIEAEKYLEEAVNMCKQHYHKNLLSKALYYRGRLYLKQSYFYTAMASLQEALQIAKEFDSKERYASIQTLIAYAYMKQGRLDKAVETYMDNIDNLKRLTPCGDYLTITKDLCYIAYIYICQDKKEEALNIYCYVLEIRMDVLPKDHADIRELVKIIEYLAHKK